MIPLTPATAEDAIRDSRDNKVKRRDGTEMNRGKMTSALARVNQQGIIDAENTEYVVEEWDRTSPINGRPATQVFATRKDIQPLPAKVYLIKRASDGHVLMFQPFQPGVGGRQAVIEDNFATVSEDHRMNVVNGRAKSKLIRALFDELGKE
jgi:hypothetical protein